MEDFKLTLAEHLEELRRRLWRVTLAVLVLGGLSFAYARELFELLMRPVLQALPEEARALVYTSGIEELNVLLKVGLYAGLFLATPVALYQLWSFVAPGLLPKERKMIGPFVGFGTLFFVGGALFCYLVVLPSMFRFLLTPGESGGMRARIEQARSTTDDAVRLLYLGEQDRAIAMAQRVETTLDAAGDGRVGAPEVAPSSRVELRERYAKMGRLIDEILPRGKSAAEQLAAIRAVELHGAAATLIGDGQLRAAAARLDEAAVAVRDVFGENPAVEPVWRAQKHLARAEAELRGVEWTRPMLSMREQLSLVLVLEVAFGAIFELPLIMALLALVGILRFRHVWAFQRYAVIACATLSALITPTGDIINLALMAVPMVVCFELGTLLVFILERRRANREEASAAPLDPA